MKSNCIHILVGLLFLLLSSKLLASSKIDTIYFQNGDRITAEVKSLENNHLRLSTNDAGTILVEWNKIDSVKIRNSMRIVLQDGAIHYGLLFPSGEVRSCFIWGRVGEPRLTPLSDIVSLSPVEERIMDRLHGSLSSGFSYTKASKVMQINLNGSVKYLAEKNQLELFYDGHLTSQDTIESSQHQNGGATFRRILPRNWFLVSQMMAETNSEQQLDLRTGLNFGGGKRIINTNISKLYIAAGLQANREVSLGESQYNMEGLIVANYSIFIYDSPEVSFNLTGFIIPSLSDPGRVRTQLDSDLKWEIFNDFYLKWTFYHRFDSRPLSTGAQKGDWGVTLLGLEYKL